MKKNMIFKLQKREAKIIEIKYGYILTLTFGVIEDVCQEIKKASIEVDLKKLFKDNDIFDSDIHNLKINLEMKFINPDKKLRDFLGSYKTLILHARYDKVSNKLEGIYLEQQ